MDNFLPEKHILEDMVYGYSTGFGSKQTLFKFQLPTLNNISVTWQVI